MIFDLGEVFCLRNVIVNDVDAFVKMAAHWNRSISRDGSELRFDVSLATLQTWTMAQDKSSKPPVWFDREFFKTLAAMECDGFVFWLEDKEAAIVEESESVPF